MEMHHSKRDCYDSYVIYQRQSQTDTRLTATFSRKTLSRYTRKVETIWILMKLEMMGWQWHQLDRIQIICTSLHIHNHPSTSSLNFFTGRMLFLTSNQQRQSTEGHYQRNLIAVKYIIPSPNALIVF